MAYPTFCPHPAGSPGGYFVIMNKIQFSLFPFLENVFFNVIHGVALKYCYSWLNCERLLFWRKKRFFWC